MLLRQDVTVTGCGRTDTGVHASYYVLHFDAETQLSETDLCYKLNAVLPKEIAFHSIQQVAADFHARFDASERSYAYYCHGAKNPFLTGQSMRLMVQPNLAAMNEAAKYFLGEHDFGAFQKQHGGNTTNICTVTHAAWSVENEQWVYRVTANRFLRNMVRAMVGTLLDVGKGKIPPQEIKEILASGERSRAGESVNACGLYLSNIKYPNLTEWQRQ